VAARVVTAEVNRDGVFEVTLLNDPEIVDGGGAASPYYVLEYLSVGKRGRKVYMNKIFISPNQLLYVLTAQCKEENYINTGTDSGGSDRESKSVKKEMEATVGSFHVL
jgi:hypothetical protein